MVDGQDVNRDFADPQRLIQSPAQEGRQLLHRRLCQRRQVQDLLRIVPLFFDQVQNVDHCLHGVGDLSKDLFNWLLRGLQWHLPGQQVCVQNVPEKMDDRRPPQVG